MENSTISNETFDTYRFDDEIKQLSRINEELRQELHDTRKHLETSQKIKTDLELEVEKLEGQIKALKTQKEVSKCEIVNSWSEKLNTLQATLDEERESYAELQLKYKDLKNIEVPKAQQTSDEYLEKMVSEFQNEVHELKSELFEKNENICALQSVNAEMMERNKCLESEINNMRETLKFKSEVLQDTLLALENTKDEKALLSCELSSLKAGPIEKENIKGNSLFSEVEDKRLNLEKKFSVLYRKYIESKRLLAVKTNELENEKRENFKYKLQIEEEGQNLKYLDHKLSDCTKRTIEELRDRIRELESIAENPKIVTISEKNVHNLKWIHTIVDGARAEARDMQRALENKSLEKLFSQEQITSLSAQVTFLQRQNIKDKAIIENLQTQLSALKNPLNESEETIPERKEASKSVKFASNVKENDGISLKVEPKKKESHYPTIFVDTTNIHEK